MSFLPEQAISVAFQTTTPLGAGGTYTSPIVVLPTDGWSQVQTEVLASHNGTLVFTFYSDAAGTDAIRTLTVPYLASEGFRLFGAPTFGRAARYTFTDTGGVGQTDFYFATKVLRTPVSPQTLAVDSFISGAMTASVERAILVGANSNATTYANIGISERDALNVEIAGPLSAFGEVLQQTPVARIQIDAVYGLVATDLETFSAGGGVASATADSLFSCAIGAGVGDYAVIRSKRTVRYLAGQGIRARGTALFTAPAVANAIQAWGMFTSIDGFFFGQNSSGQFGVWRRVAGAAAIYRLTITNGATGVENMTVTLDGVAFVIASGGALSAAATAERIAEVGVFTGWASAVSPTSNGATVTFIQGTPGTTPGAFTFASTGGATGGIVQVQAGAANSDTAAFVAQSAWNVDTCDGSNSANNPSGVNLNWARLNVFEIVHAYLGAGTIRFRVMAPNGKMITVHRMEYPNSAVIPNQKNPSYRIGWICASLGSASALTVRGSSAAAFIEGEVHTTRDPYAYDQSFAGQTTEYYAFAIRNRGEFRSTVNQRLLLPSDLALGLSATNRAIRARVYINPTLTGVVNWQYVDATLSCAEFAAGSGTVSPITPSGGRLVATAVASGGGVNLDLHDLDLRLEPGDVLVVSLLAQGGTADCFVGVNWQEI